MMMPDTCLFTGVPLHRDTKDEHVILEKLGGHITSKSVTSSDFNNRSSDLDNFFLSAYGLLLRQLGPLLASKNKSGDLRISIPGHGEQQIFMDGDGGLYLRGFSILGKGDDKIPNVYVGDDVKQMLRQVRRSGKDPEKVKLTIAALTNAMEAFVEGPILEPRLEICALKCILATFDHFLREPPPSVPRFTRDPLLRSARELVRRQVHDAEADLQELSRVSLGIQYKKLELYRRLRGERIPLPPQEFEHLMLARANPYNGTLDAVWWVLGIDPFGFRLTSQWTGEPFTLMIASGSLRDAQTSPLIVTAEEVFLCEPTQYRFVSGPASLVDMQVAAEVISGQRMDAQNDAIVLVERSCSNLLLARRLHEAALVDPGNDMRAVTAVRRRLSDKLFVDSATSGRDAELLDNILNRELSKLSDEELEVIVPKEFDADEAASFWNPFVAIYRSAFEAILREVGRPRLLLSREIIVGPPGSGDTV